MHGENHVFFTESHHLVWICPR